MNYKSYANLYMDIKRSLHRLNAVKVDLVVGVPRSGMIPAYMIALALNVNCTDLSSFSVNARVSKGITRAGKKELVNAWDAKNVLLVDDSILSGKSMLLSIGKIPLEYPGRVTTLAIYSSLPRRSDVDMFLEYVSPPRVFEWNIFHHGLLSRACVNIDGVLCMAPSKEQESNDAKYDKFLVEVEPYIIPVYKIHSLVTNRLEKDRLKTEKWLTNHGIEYENLIMLNSNNMDDVFRFNAGVEHKASYYKKSGLDFFIESDSAQAKGIFDITGKPVFCVNDNIMYSPALLTRAAKDPSSLFSELSRYAVFIPEPMRRFVRVLRNRG